MDRIFTGGDSGEHLVRELLLGATIENVEQVIDRDEGDTLTLKLTDGHEVRIRAERLYLEASLVHHDPAMQRFNLAGRLRRRRGR